MTAASPLELLQSGRYEALVEHCQRDLAQEPRHAGALEFLAYGLVQLGRYGEAEAVLDRLIAIRPEAPEFRTYLGTLLSHQGKLEAAEAMLLAARALRAGDPACEFQLGLVQFKLLRFREAAAAFAIVRQRAPALAEVSAVYESRCRTELGEIEFALALARSVRAPERLEVAQIEEYATACMGVNLFDEAERALRAGLVKAPRADGLRSKLAQICERSNRLDEARRWLAEIAEPDLHAAHLSVRIEARDRPPGDALALLDAMCERYRERIEENPDLQAQVAFDRGRWLESAARYDEAASAFAIGNRLDREAFLRNAQGFPVEGGLPAFAESARARASEPHLAAVRALSGAEPIFLVGFPRSGTTLLDQMLDAHPSVQVLEEKPLIGQLLQGRAGAGQDGTRTLAAFAPHQLPALRQQFWALANSHLKLEPGKRFVDKNPFNLGWVYFIHHLFPRAKWIYAIRHPLDSILSCYTNRFRYTEFSHGFWSLEETARIYRDVVGYWLSMREQLDIDCYDLRYEALVDDPRGQFEALCRFLDLDWHEGSLEFHRHARQRKIMTPSYDQVVKPIYRGAVERWRHYAPTLAPSIEIVRPLLETLGYPA